MSLIIIIFFIIDNNNKNECNLRNAIIIIIIIKLLNINNFILCLVSDKTQFVSQCNLNINSESLSMTMLT